MNAEPQLAKPGAGLPAVELQIGRILFWVRRHTGNSASFTALFEAERQHIRDLVAKCSPADASIRVLIDRVRGIEDSSRYWSVWMTLDHLRIVNSQISQVIRVLASGKVPPGTASTAAVKPSAKVTEAVVQEYEASCDGFLNVVKAGTNLSTPVRFAHPWFGPLDASGWHAIAGGHMRIHRVQIERILDGVGNAAKGS